LFAALRVCKFRTPFPLSSSLHSTAFFEEWSGCINKKRRAKSTIHVKERGENPPEEKRVDGRARRHQGFAEGRVCVSLLIIDEPHMNKSVFLLLSDFERRSKLRLVHEKKEEAA
jgi:hypothetical protein